MFEAVEACGKECYYWVFRASPTTRMTLSPKTSSKTRYERAGYIAERTNTAEYFRVHVRETLRLIGSDISCPVILSLAGRMHRVICATCDDDTSARDIG